MTIQMQRRLNNLIEKHEVIDIREVIEDMAYIKVIFSRVWGNTTIISSDYLLK